MRELRILKPIAKLEDVEALDAIVTPAKKLVVGLLSKSRTVEDVLHGTPIGHPLHPLLILVPAGAWVSAAVLDLIPGTERAARILVGAGLLAAVPTVATGEADWSRLHEQQMRVGVIHATANLTAVGLYTASWLARRSGAPVLGKALGFLGFGAVTAGGYLGGHLSFGHGVGVNHAFLQRGPDEWTEVLPAADLEAGTPRRVDVGDATVLLVRRGEEVLAIGSRCTHAGGPLEEGTVDPREGTVECPWHQSVFRLDDGSVVHGPASVPEHAYDVRVRHGAVELRRRAAP